MRVAFLQSSLGIGGAERLVQTIVAGLDRARIEPLAVNLYGPGPVGEQLAAAGLEVVSGLAASRWDPRAGRRLAAALRELQADLVYVADSALPLFWAGRLRRAAPRPRLVLGFHSTGKSGDRLQHALANAAALPVADRFVALAPSHRDFLVRRFRLAPERFAVIPSGVDTARFRPAEDRPAAKRALGWPDGAPVVSIVAALRPEKDHRLFLRAAAALAARCPGTRFVVVGDGPERAALERRARSLGLGREVAFLGARHDTPEIQRASDVAVLCSLPVVETFPVTLVESLASGTPVVSTDVGSIRDVVRAEETGLLVPPGDAAALAAAIERLLGDSALRARMGAAARADARARLTRERMIADYERLFLEVGSG
ncbi:MAG: glycosyltransferase [Candidatus Eisenbacteria bacterium]|nr:glycosyltransferase [Candidatus Eisenbacteria bacterium]